MNFEPAAFRVACFGKGIVSRLAGVIEIVVLVVRPDAGDLSGTYEAGDIVYVSVSFVGVDTVLYPDDFLKVEVF